MRLSAGCFGKLPIHGDFIRHNVGPEVDRLDEWLQAGIVSSRTAMGTAWDGSFDATPPQRFLYQVAGGRVVAGVVAASIDKPGRRYPFLIFTILDPKSLGGEVTSLPAQLSSFFHRAEQEALTGWQGQELKSYLTRIDALALPADFEDAKQSLIKFVAGQTVQAFWNTLFGSDQDPRKYMLIHNLVETLKGGAVPKYALRFPQVSADAEVAFWEELCRKLARRPGLPTLSLWGSGREAGHPGLSMVFDDLKATYFSALWWPEKKNNLMFPLAEETAGTDTRLSAAKSKYAALLDDGNMRLSNLMVRLGS
ncbi:MAG TPA: type VI secretion system-associated protein TagF [Planctomycetota bacterium]|nr:type VI secretion system-associated protein TagF [Planctomycetota bacterium]